MQVCRENMQVGISLLEPLHKFVQDRCGKLPIFALGIHIVLVSNLEDHFVEGLLLFAGTDLLIIVFDDSVGAGLLGVVGFQGYAEQGVVNFVYVLVAVHNVVGGSFGVGILCVEFSAVVIDRSFADHNTNRSFYNLTSFRRAAAGFVTFSKSNAKALLTAGQSKAHCALRGRTGNAASAEASVTVRVDGDGVLDTAPTIVNIDTTVTHRHTSEVICCRLIFLPA